MCLQLSIPAFENTIRTCSHGISGFSGLRLGSVRDLCRGIDLEYPSIYGLVLFGPVGV